MIVQVYLVTFPSDREPKPGNALVGLCGVSARRLRRAGIRLIDKSGLVWQEACDALAEDALATGASTRSSPLTAVLSTS